MHYDARRDSFTGGVRFSDARVPERACAVKGGVSYNGRGEAESRNSVIPRLPPVSETDGARC